MHRTSLVQVTANTSCALKKVAPSTENTNTPKVVKKGGRGKNNVQSKAPTPPLSTSDTFPMKGGPLSPLTAGSSSDGLPSPEHSKAGKAMRLRDGPSDESKKKHVKPRPVTKDSQVVMNRGLRMVYRESDSESDINEGTKADSATTTGAIPEPTGAANVQSDFLEQNSTQLTKDEVVGDPEEELPQTAPLNLVAPTIPDQQPLRDSSTPRPRTPSKTQDECPHDTPRADLTHDAPRPRTPSKTQDERAHDIPRADLTHDAPRDGRDAPRGPLHDPPRDPRDGRNPPRGPLHDPRDGRDPPHGPLRDPQDSRDPPRGPLHDPRDGHDPPRGPLHDPRDVRNPAYNYCEGVHDPRNDLHDPHYPHTRGYSQEPVHGLDCDTLHPHDAFYHHNSRNSRYGPPQDLYASGDTCDSSPVSDFYANYSPDEREHAYPSRYSPGVDSGYGREGGYRSRRDDLDERGQLLPPYHSRPVGGGNYREDGYGRRFQDSRWGEAAHLDYGRDAIPRAFSRDLPNPRPPPTT
ncbi:hypothetical protein EV424DRAFT_1546129 [Suillus variegatus]|nr:hypothetical protein EV424DRAFT_1546129 [Suillus variegatus]